MSRHEAHGPRIIFKDDRDSSIGRGCILFAAHFRPEIMLIPRVCAAVAPKATQIVRVTEGWRDIRDTRDRHEDLCALDLTLEMPVGRATKEEYARVVDSMRAFLGPDYDVIAHGEGFGHHIHCEWDPET